VLNFPSSALRQILQHHATTGKLQHGRTQDFFLRAARGRRYSSACHGAGKQLLSPT
jgi:hypothetical protein